MLFYTGRIHGEYNFRQYVYPRVMKHLFVSRPQVFIRYVSVVGSVLICLPAVSMAKTVLFDGVRFA